MQQKNDHMKSSSIAIAVGVIFLLFFGFNYADSARTDALVAEGKVEVLEAKRAELEKEAEDAAASAAEAQEEISSASAPPPAAPPQASAAAAPLHTAGALRTFSQIEIDGMRVVDLKEELVNRSLSTKGLKRC